MKTPTTQPLLTINTDEAVITVHTARARAAGLTEDGIARLVLDASALATAVGDLAGCEFEVRRA